eukprot:GHVL01007666.1.p1 GENE.GHVL01007666.1~~GHVL01007666.1.p1  ORF type:complete len:473 (+),score=114.81 GHVL01007666.1:212-1420(+)
MEAEAQLHNNCLRQYYQPLERQFDNIRQINMFPNETFYDPCTRQMMGQMYPGGVSYPGGVAYPPGGVCQIYPQVGGTLYQGGCTAMYPGGSYQVMGAGYNPQGLGMFPMGGGSNNDIYNNCEVSLNELHFDKNIGSGATADVYKQVWRGTEVAVKRLKIDNVTDKVLKEFDRELNILARLRHDNIVRFMAAHTTSSPLCIITEWCEGGTLFDLLHNQKRIWLNWHQKLRIILDLARGMFFLHTEKPPVIHRDLKSLNLLLKEPIRSPTDIPLLKISDFGMSKMKKQASANWGCMTGAAGTYHWMAPEVLSGDNYNESADVYSFGIVLYEIITRSIPYIETAKDPLSIAMAVSKGRRPSLNLVPSDCPQALCNLMIRCWDAQSINRPNFENIFNCVISIKIQF